MKDIPLVKTLQWRHVEQLHGFALAVEQGQVLADARQLQISNDLPDETVLWELTDSGACAGDCFAWRQKP